MENFPSTPENVIDTTPPVGDGGTGEMGSTPPGEGDTGEMGGTKPDESTGTGEQSMPSPNTGEMNTQVPVAATLGATALSAMEGGTQAPAQAAGTGGTSFTLPEAPTFTANATANTTATLPSAGEIPTIPMAESTAPTPEQAAPQAEATPMTPEQHIAKARELMKDIHNRLDQIVAELEEAATAAAVEKTAQAEAAGKTPTDTSIEELRPKTMEQINVEAQQNAYGNVDDHWSMPKSA